jgi:hypothetical protein
VHALFSLQGLLTCHVCTDQYARLQADLFKDLHLHWPPRFLAFVHQIASIFNFSLPKLPFLTKIRPECAFSLSFTQKWFLEMFSPFLLGMALLLFVAARILAATLARELLARRYNKGDKTQLLMCTKREGKSTVTNTKLCRRIGVWLAVAAVLGCSVYVFDQLHNRSKNWTQQDEDHAAISSDHLIIGFIVALIVALVCVAPLLFRTDSKLVVADEDDLNEPLSTKEEIEDVGLRTSFGNMRSLAQQPNESEEAYIMRLIAPPTVDPEPESPRLALEPPPQREVQAEPQTDPEAADDGTLQLNPSSETPDQDDEGEDDAGDDVQPTWLGGLFGGALAGAFGALLGNFVDFGDHINQGLGHAICVLVFALPAAYKCSQSEPAFISFLKNVEDFDHSAQWTAFLKVRYILLVFGQVGYVFLVSSALEPLSCYKDVDKKMYMSANPQIECNWCASAQLEFYDTKTGELTYPAIATFSYLLASIYGFGIPALFFKIMYYHRTVLRKQEFTKNYGFLTSKTSENFCER